MSRLSLNQLIDDLESWLGVILAGLITTGLSLFAVHLYSERYHEDPMSVYFFYIFPVGAIIVGVASGIGYLFAASYSGVRLSKPALWLIAILQILAYFFARYLQFRSHHYVYRGTFTPVSFWYHFHLTAISYVFNSFGGEELHLGLLGYLLRAWEIALFVLSGVVVPSTLARRPYCAACKAYLKDKELALIPAEELIPDPDTIPAAELPQAITDSGKTAFDALATIAESGNAPVFSEQVNAFPPRRIRGNLPSRLEISMRYCPFCLDGKLLGRTIIVRSVSRSITRHARRVSSEFVEGIK